LPFSYDLGFNGHMTKTLNTKESKKILEAAYEALEYAIEHTKMINEEEVDKDEILIELEQGFNFVNKALFNDIPLKSIRGHVSNSFVHLRLVLHYSLESDIDDEHLIFSTSAVSRAIRLLYPITQVDGPIRQVPRKDRSRRKVVVSKKKENLSKFIINIKKDVDTNFFTGFDGSISSGGLFIATYNIHPLGTTLEINVSGLPSGRILTGIAEVTWIREHNDTLPDVFPGMGVIFKNLNESAKKEIDYYLSEHDSIFYEAV